MSPSDRIDELKKRYDENPRRFFASLANEYRKAGDLEQAIALCQLHLAEQPSNMNGHVVYGQALFEAGRYDDAKGTFETALTLDPENLIALRHLGDIACTNGANDEAREWYKRVLDADPRNDEILALLATLDAEPSRTAPASAEPVHERTMELTPREPTSTPLGTPAVAAATPVIPIESVVAERTPVIATPAVPPPRESIGLMDLAIDFEPTSQAPVDEAPAAPAAAAAPLADDDFPSFGDVALEPHVESAAAEPAAFPDFVLEPPMAESVAMLEMAAVEETPAAARDSVEDMLFGDSVPAEPAAPFVTETMAQLYLQQGFNAEALEVYRQLAAANPHDENFREQMARLEGGAHAAAAVPTEATAAESAGALTARSYFAALAMRRAVQGNGRAHEAPPPPEGIVPVESEPAVEAPAPEPAVSAQAPAPVAAAGASLDDLFGGGAVSDADENIARAFAQVAGAVEMGAASVQGKPTAPAASDLSLDSVFREADARATSTVARQSQTIRFDQFFATADEDAAPQAPAVSAPTGEPGSPAELQQFQSWLGGLKKP